jgi:phosphoglycerol transferase
MPGMPKAALHYGLAALGSLAAAVPLLKLWRADLRVPFDYQGDGLSAGLMVKSILEQGWYQVHPRLGAPGVLTLHDYPFADAAHFLAIKLMGLFSADWALVLNLYYLLGFPLIAVAALAVLRHGRVAPGPALVASLLFAFLPSRVLKGAGHVFLDNFYQVPLAILVVLWVCGDAPPLVRAAPGRRWPTLHLRSRRSIAALAICLLTASTGVYYAGFAAALLLVGGAWASLRRRATAHAVAGALLAATLVGGLALHGLPTLLHQRRHGANPEVAVRLPEEAERFGMKITQLLLPIDGHRVDALRRFKDRYNASGSGVGEGSASALGLLASGGFLYLLALVLLGPARPRAADPPAAELLEPLAVLNLAAVMLATAGGFGSLFAFLVTPQIRTWSRINVVIGFLSLFALALLSSRFSRARPRAAALLLPAVLLVGLLDQSSTLAVRPYERTGAGWASDAGFVRAIEAATPAGAMVFQLPYLSFPESPPQHRMAGYDPLRLYLHSRSLRWSYPAMRGRPDDLWIAAVAARPPPAMLETLCDADFAGIAIDRRGYADGGAAIEAELAALLQATPTASDDGRFAHFPLAAHRARLRLGRSPAEQEQRRMLARHPLLLRWGQGFYGLERRGDLAFRWCRGACDLEILNGSSATRSATLAMTLVPAQAPARFTATGPLLSEQIPLDPAGTPFTRRLTVPPGAHRLRLASDGPPADAPGDPRTLVWRAEAPTLLESDP